MAGDEVSLVDVVGRLDGIVTETQMRNGHATGLLGVILEVSLNVLAGMVADDLDGVLVSTDSAVAAQTPELALDGAFCSGVGGDLLVQGQEGDVVDDTQGELFLGLILSQLFVDCEEGGRSGVLRAQTVTAADYFDVASAVCSKSCNNVKVRFTYPLLRL